MPGAGSNCRYSSNLYHECNEYCIKIISEAKKSAGKNEGQHPDCRYLSNPYHLCNEYCFKIITETKKRSSKNEEQHPNCRFLSNPYHECNEYCNKTTTERRKPPSKNEERHPDCRFLSNPYHECNEYCFKMIADSEKLTSENESGYPRRVHLFDSDERDKSSSENETDGLEADTRRSFQPNLVATELPNVNSNEKSNEWKRLFGEISKLNNRVDQLEAYQNGIREEAERRHREILQRLDLLQLPPTQH